MLDKTFILNSLGEKALSFDINIFDEVDSTNNVIKTLAEDGVAQGAVAIAVKQYSGRGRKGRSFISPDGGLYFSLLLRPKTDAQTASLITCAAAVAVCEAIEQVTEYAPTIKWVNDILIDGKKVCGILTESKIGSRTGTLDYAILGIGINVFEPAGGFDESIKDIACALFKTEKANAREELASAVLIKLHELFDYTNPKLYYERYKERSVLIGKTVNVISSDDVISATVVGLDSDFRLLVEYDNGKFDALSSGEVSVRAVEN